jgi:hypothetical protein
VACSKPEKKAEPAQPKPAASVQAAQPEQKRPEATVQTAGEPATKIPDGEIATQEDFEEEATTKMASANLELELDALESEIGD